MAGDMVVLLDMGFDKERAELALKKTGSCKVPLFLYLNPALQWLEENQDKSWEEISAKVAADAEEEETNPSIEAAPLKEGEVAQSLVCDICGRKLRSVAQAEAHGERTHVYPAATNGGVEEIAPLTEEEKKARLQELREKAAEKKAAKAILDREEAKANEKIRQKSTREVADAKENLAKQEQIKAAAKKRQEKIDDLAAKRRIQEKIAADKEARRLKAEAQKAEREGRAPPPDPTLAAAASAQASSSGGSAPKKEVTDARLRLQTATGVVTKTFPVDTTLFEVAQGLEAENAGVPVESFTMTYPKKTFTGGVDFSKTLKEAGLAPSAVLIVK
ncbi:related to chicken h-caldesmon, Uso1p and YKL201c [Rhynchosporium secalis]|uniref:Related to chicken h-caldesmon, Uso1p and YKL201c n=1 Tax=Rhynchosporium secalis TaxID=38038 RepID=A0A1E1M774_RHYSE|nr:related to chicken h-caldesmon, Uso1p and YKL201c [Rhynchosporium secalis]